MSVQLAPGQSVNLVAVYTMSDGTTRPADDAVFSDDNSAVAAGSSTGPGAETVTAVADGVDNVTASGQGFTSAPFEVDVVTPVTVTGIEIQQA